MYCAHQALKKQFVIPLILSAFIFLLSCSKEKLTDASGNNPVPSPSSLTPKPVRISNHTNGYYEYLPEGYFTDPTDTKYSLLIFFHGGAEVGQDSAALDRLLIHGPLKFAKNGLLPKSFTVNGNTHKFIIIAPQFTSTDDSYPNEVDQIIEYVKQNYKVDVSRIYLTGLSFGGGLSWNYVGKNSNYAKKIAAVVPVASYIHESRDAFHITTGKAQIIAASNLPVWSTHNSGDNICPLSWTINAHGLLKNFNPNLLQKVTIFNANTHEGWTQTYDPSFKQNSTNIYEWMLQYHR